MVVRIVPTAHVVLIHPSAASKKVILDDLNDVQIKETKDVDENKFRGRLWKRGGKLFYRVRRVVYDVLPPFPSCLLSHFAASGNFQVAPA
jgi:hypothetical protein